MTPIERSEPERGTRASAQVQPMFHRVLSAQPETVRDTLQDVRRRFHGEVSDDTLGRLELVLAEVMNNVAEHAPAGAGNADDSVRLPVIHLCIVRHTNGLACALTDDGVSLPDECILPRSLPALVMDDLPEGGFGWFLIQDLTQALCYYRESQRNYLAFSIPFAQSGAA
ncbi:MAG: ATP-binding protein [Paracoccus sp. (in: a-proteobacteria)]|uniref:ATP-binding protein n=1 Tax=Paracoccus sp. TaxID=267 RepID=UPI002E8517B3|nr:ATP-binding protein [Pseudomonadota bacterium]